MVALSLAKQQGVKILSLTRGTLAPLARLSDWNLQAAVALQGKGSRVCGNRRRNDGGRPDPQRAGRAG